MEMSSNRDWAAANPERMKYLYRRGNLKKYNITPEDFDALLEAQGGACAMCGTTTPGGRGRFHVDHDHSCCPGTANSCGDCIRGLLCHACNVILGNANDSVERLLQGVAYLTRS